MVKQQPKLNTVLKRLCKIQQQRTKILRRVIELQRKEETALKWLFDSDWTHVCSGNCVFILNDIQHPATNDGSDRRATVRYARRTRSGQFLIFVTTDNGFKTHRASNNLRRL